MQGHQRGRSAKAAQGTALCDFSRRRCCANTSWAHNEPTAHVVGQHESARGRCNGWVICFQNLQGSAARGRITAAHPDARPQRGGRGLAWDRPVWRAGSASPCLCYGFTDGLRGFSGTERNIPKTFGSLHPVGRTACQVEETKKILAAGEGSCFLTHI